MASSMVLKVASLAMIMMCMVLSLTQTQAAPSCGNIQVTLAPCISYLKGNGKDVPKQCCNGIKKINDQTKSTQDRQSVCNCIKKTAQSIKGLNPDKVASLPSKCGINLPYDLKPSTDCNKIK